MSLYSDFVVTTAKASPTGEIYALAKKEGVALKIGELLTPNGDGKNNVLKISNIELFPVNTVTLIDRYGVPVHKWTVFKNYSTTDSKQDFDFTTLAIGNYICVVQYTDPRTGPAKVTQMITVLAPSAPVMRNARKRRRNGAARGNPGVRTGLIVMATLLGWAATRRRQARRTLA